MPELRLSMTTEARTVLTDLLRLIAPAAARVSVNRARVPEADGEVAAFWIETLKGQAIGANELIKIAQRMQPINR